MSRFAPVAPIALLEQMAEAYVLGDYHLLIASDIKKEPLRYKKLFSKEMTDFYVKILDISGGDED